MRHADNGPGDHEHRHPDGRADDRLHAVHERQQGGVRGEAARPHESHRDRREGQYGLLLTVRRRQRAERHGARQRREDEVATDL